jgi:septum formation protein
VTRLILASASPRRGDLLNRLGFLFETIPSGVSEALDAPLPPEQHVLEIALRKARSVASRTSDAIVIAADSVVVVQNTILEKPRDAGHAVAMLTMLSGETHQVFTGLVLVNTLTGRTHSDVAVTQVKMRDLSAEEIDRYVATGDPLDKAGAYAVQGLSAVFIESISGCFYNVVGLPLTKFWSLLHASAGESPWAFISPGVTAPDLLGQNT